MKVCLDKGTQVIVDRPDGGEALSGIASLSAARQSGCVSNRGALGRRRAVDPSKLAKLIGRQVSTVSIHLGKLRAADVVRYDTSGKETLYWLKHKSEMKGLLKILERVVNASAKLE